MTKIELNQNDLQIILSWAMVHQYYYDHEEVSDLLVNSEDADQITLTKVKALLYMLKEEAMKPSFFPPFLSRE